MVTKGLKGEGINWKTGINMLLYIKWKLIRTYYIAQGILINTM